MIKSFAVAFGEVDNFCLSGALAGQGPIKWGKIRELYRESGRPQIVRKIFRLVVHRLAKYGRLKKGRTRSVGGTRTVPVYTLAHRRPITYNPATTLPISLVLLPTLLLLIAALYLVLR